LKFLVPRGRGRGKGGVCGPQKFRVREGKRRKCGGVSLNEDGKGSWKDDEKGR